MADEEQLEEEREFARKNRDKFAAYGGTGTMAAAPAAGSGGMGPNSKYQGFGSADLNKYSGGYDIHGANKGGSTWDPYKRKGGSVFDKEDKPAHHSKKHKKAKKEEKPKKKHKKRKKSESESSDSSDSDSSEESDKSDSDESSEEEKPKKKSKKSQGLSKPKESKNGKTKKEEKVEKPSAPKQDIFEMIDTTDEPAPASTGNQGSGLEGLGLDFGSTPQPAAQPTSQVSSDMFANMNFGNPPPQQNTQSTGNDMFSNMNVAGGNAQQPQSWGAWGSQPQQPAAAQQTPVQQTTDLFGNMSLNQPQNPPTQQNSGFDMFSGMSQPAQQTAPPVQSQSSTSGGDFGAFQESAPAQTAPTKPKKDDAWSMGGGLFNLSGLKKDSERQDKLTSQNKNKTASPYKEPNMLHTKGMDLNNDNVWGSAFGQSSSGASAQANTNFGFSGSSGSGFQAQSNSGFPSSGAQMSTGFGGNTQWNAGSNQNNFSSGFGQQNNQFSSGFPSSGFPGSQPQPSQQNSGFPGGNQWGQSQGFPSSGNNSSPFI